MTKLTIRSSVVAVLALGAGLSVSSAYAQERFAAPYGDDAGYAQPFADQQASAQPNVMGHYTCGYNELHTRLERKNCGGYHSRY